MKFVTEHNDDYRTLPTTRRTTNMAKTTTQKPLTADKPPKPKKKSLIKTDPRAMAMRSIMDGPGFQQAMLAALPKHISPERMVRVVMSSFQVTPKLLECTPESVLLSMMRAAMMGLEPDGGTLGHGYLVPYFSGKRQRTECQFIPGYRGLIQLARNSGDVVDVWAEVVRKEDVFSYERGLHPKLEHKPVEIETPGPIIAAYACAKFRDPDVDPKFEVMTAQQIRAIRDESPGYNTANPFGPWKDHEAEMFKKTALRRLTKTLPLSAERQERIGAENVAIDFAQALQGQAIALPSPPGDDPGESGESGEALTEAFQLISDCITTDELADVATQLLSEANSDELSFSIDEMVKDRAKAIKEGGEGDGSA